MGQLVAAAPIILGKPVEEAQEAEVLLEALLAVMDSLEEQAQVQAPVVHMAGLVVRVTRVRMAVRVVLLVRPAVQVALAVPVENLALVSVAHRDDSQDSKSLEKCLRC